MREGLDAVASVFGNGMTLCIVSLSTFDELGGSERTDGIGGGKSTSGSIFGTCSDSISSTGTDSISGP